MPLSEHEQRLLDQIERALYAEDPKFASSVRSTDLRTHMRRRLRRAAFVLVVGVVLLILGLSTNPAVGIAGFAVMVGALLLGLSALKRLGGNGASLRSVGARVHLITDGDVAGVINTTDPATGIDIYIGSGGAPEGVLACAALKCVGGQFQGRLVFRNEDEKARARRIGLTDSDFSRKYDLDDLVKGDAVFSATGVTKGALLDGVRYENGFVHTHTLVMNSATRTVREVRMKRPV